MRTITLANGKTFNVCFFGEADGFLRITVTGPMTLAEGLTTFGDAEAVQTITRNSEDYEAVIEGYTVLTGLELQADGLHILLKRGEVNGD